MPTARPQVARGALRGVRASVVATAALALAATAHVVGGASLPSLPVLALVVVPLAWGAVALTARPLGPVALTVGLGAAQVVLHEALMVLSGPACAPAAAGDPMGGMAGMLGPVGPTALCTSHAMPAVTSATAAMVAAHAVATALTALVLARGEQVLLALLTLLSAPLRRVDARTAAARVVDVRATVHRPTWPDVVELASAVLDAAGGRRGPPLAAAAAPAR
jgi:hypothetical protein